MRSYISFQTAFHNNIFRKYIYHGTKKLEKKLNKASVKLFELVETKLKLQKSFEKLSKLNNKRKTHYCSTNTLWFKRFISTPQKKVCTCGNTPCTCRLNWQKAVKHCINWLSTCLWFLHDWHSVNPIIFVLYHRIP